MSKRIPPVYVLMECGHAVAMTMWRVEAEQWMGLGADQDYVAYETLESIPVEFRMSMLAERVKTVESRLGRCQGSLEHHAWEHSGLRKIIEPEPANPVDPYRHETGHGRGGFLSRMLNFSGYEFWPKRKK
jgi:hypothetical protein